MRTAVASDRASCGHKTVLGTAVPFDVLDTAGAYVCNWSGHLLRIPESAVARGRTPVLNIVGNQPLTVTKISNDPGVGLSEAKRLAAGFNLSVTF